MSANLVINTIELSSTTRPAPYKGSPSTADYNSSQEETLNDLVSLSECINNVLIPMLRALPSTAISGLEGRNIFGDTTDQTIIFTDPTTGVPLSIADSIRTVYSILNTQSTTLSNINILVGQLSQKLSSTNQNDVAITLQNITSSINTLTSQNNSVNAAITELQSSNGKIKTIRQSDTINATTTSMVNVPWPTAFADNNYTVNISYHDASGGLAVTINGFVYLSAGSGIAISITNSSGVAQDIVINVIAVHD